MSGQFVDRLLRQVGAKTIEPTYSRLPLSRLQHEYKPIDNWTRVFGKKRLTVAALLSASLIVFCLVSCTTGDAFPIWY